jgi:hypothetical protein
MNPQCFYSTGPGASTIKLFAAVIDSVLSVLSTD